MKRRANKNGFLFYLKKGRGGSTVECVGIKCYTLHSSTSAHQCHGSHFSLCDCRYIAYRCRAKPLVCAFLEPFAKRRCARPRTRRLYRTECQMGNRQNPGSVRGTGASLRPIESEREAREPRMRLGKAAFQAGALQIDEAASS